MTRWLVIMGSGETTPTMIKPHRQIFAALPPHGKAAVLDTPYGFQLNADEISARTVAYFAQSVRRKVDLVSWRRRLPPGLERERALASLREANWIFAGPGSPTYALRQWRDTELPELMIKATALVFASAAALTLGSHTVPVYEIYKAGRDPCWEPGLDLFAKLTGVPAVIIPHYDNAEGGHHDTRFCYLGAPRLSYLERELPEETMIVGVDEHTALVCDLAERTASVLGNGGLTLRRHGRSVRHESGSVLSLDLNGPAGTVAPAPAAAPAGEAPPVSLRAAADRLMARFTTAAEAGDIDACVTAALELEQTITDWAADTLSSGDTDHARGILRGMVVILGRLAGTAQPFIAAMVRLRARARQDRDFAAADEIRTLLAAGGIDLRDTPDGPQWTLDTAPPGR